jgi:uncharacterized membrane protein
MLIGLIPYAEPYLGVLAFVGFILILIGLRGLAGYYKQDGIFDNALYGFIAAIIGVVAAVATALYVIFDTSTLTKLLQDIYPSWNGSWSTIGSLGTMTPNTSNIPTSDILSALGAIFAVFVILWIFLIVSAFFDRRSLKMLSTKTNVGLFSTAALLLIIGAVLSIVLIGFILMWIAVLLMAIAFFQIKPQPEQPAAAPAVPPP